MNKKGDQYTHIATSSASFSPEKKNALVWKDKNGFITIFCNYPTISRQIMDHHEI